jgi:hypothetical protein
MVLISNLNIHFLFCAETHCFSAAYFSWLILFGEVKNVYFCNHRNKQVYYKQVGRGSVVGIATRYGLDSPGIESRWGARISSSVHSGTGAYPASYTMHKAAGACC